LQFAGRLALQATSFQAKGFQARCFRTKGARLNLVPERTKEDGREKD
jgi:hypothetical protein